MSHTPGPWGAARVNGTAPTTSITGASGALLADVYHAKNVPIIQAAPALLAALEDVVHRARVYMESSPTSRSLIGHERWEALHTSVVKAEAAATLAKGQA